ALIDNVAETVSAIKDRGFTTSIDDTLKLNVAAGGGGAGGGTVGARFTVDVVVVLVLVLSGPILTQSLLSKSGGLTLLGGR
ncbi:MAG TPA: hypothetical protein VMB73_12975, partial [Acetobacteraceae bacterium]|nr:hypothetical protein [Acetobacteraceae bacterium]